MDENVPFQVANIIRSLLDEGEDIYIRGNYRNRLVTIQTAITNAIKKYDSELYLANTNFKKKKSYKTN